MSICADLHIHSNASDGELSPDQIIQYAALNGLKAIALTDHDTLVGVKRVFSTHETQGLKIITGVEISAEHDPGILHILGYFPTYPNGLESDLDKVQKARRDRIPKVIRKLNDLGLTITQDDVFLEAGDSQVGRPHIARALLKKKYVRSFDDAFDLYLGKGKKAYVPKEKMTWENSIALIKQYGGLPVLAHPYTLSLCRQELVTLIVSMRESGLEGIEVYYPDHSADQIAFYASIAWEMGLLETGGTDFHGTYRREVSIGEFGIEEHHLETFLMRLDV